MLVIRYGGYRHRVGEGDLTIERRPIQNAKQITVMVEETWTWTGRLRSQSKVPDYRTLIPVINALEQAYKLNGQDLVLEHMNGTPTHHSLRNSDCLGGTRVVQPPSFPEGKNAENVNYRSYRVAVSGIRIVRAGMQLKYKSFTEQIQIRGGGRRWGLVEVNNGPPIRQQLRTHTICTATQSGSYVSLLGLTEEIPPAIWPYALVDEFPDYSETSPQVFGESPAAMVDRAVSWSYNFAWSSRLFGEPHYLL